THRVERDAGIAGVGEGGNTVAETLGDTITRRVEEHVPRENGALRARETKDPGAEVEILEKAAHRGELEVGVRIDEPRKQDRVSKVDRAARRRGRRGTDVGDAVHL